MRKSIVLFLAVILGLTAGIPARAQTGPRLSLFALQSGYFPGMSALLDVFDSGGNFVTGLSASQVSLVENGQVRPADRLEELQPGTQFVLAFDPGPAFAFRDPQAVSRFDKVVEALQAWAASHPDSLGDDLSLVATGASSTTHLDATADFSAALAAYQPDLQSIVPSLDTLARALEAVSEPTPVDGMKRVVLYITSPPTPDTFPTLQSLTGRAMQAQARVHVWIVSSEDFFNAAGATALKDLAINTGGQYVLFSGEEPLPGLEAYLAPLRHTYRLSYTSGIRAPGGHTLAAQVNLNTGTVVSEPLAFDLDVQPPNPILVAPPQQIVRRGAEPTDADFAAFEPARQEIEAIIEFPDGRPRPLVRTALYVDGLLVHENLAEPFDRFTWDLSAYAASGEHTLQLEAMDSLGLRKASLGIPVTVTVLQPERGLLAFLARNSLWVALGAVFFAGAVLAVALAWGRVRRLREAQDPGSTRPSERSLKDPLTQPVPAAEVRRRLPWARPARQQSDAYLLRLKDGGEPITGAPIPVTAPETIFGSDPLQATRILEDPSVSPLHARLKEQDGGYVLSDEGSAAGTWVNYEQLTAPRRLEHGDLLNIGQISYRFMLRKPPERPAPRLTPLKE